MATIPTDLTDTRSQNAAGILSTLLGKVRLFSGAKTDQHMTFAERVEQADADYYDRFYG